MPRPPLKRVLFKMSGEVLRGDDAHGIDPDVCRRLAGEVADAHERGVQVAMVIGGGNLFRGASLAKSGIERVTADQIGMLGTVVNGLALRDFFRGQGVPTHVFSAVAIAGVVDRFERGRAIAALERSSAIILVGGTGNPYFTTDSAAALRALELDCDALVKGTKVDGVYDKDPMANADAKRFSELSYDEVLSRQLRVMDLSAIALCAERGLPVLVFNVQKPGELGRLLGGDDVGTYVAAAAG